MTLIAKGVVAFRERTGCEMMGCKRALAKSNDGIDAAVDILKEKGLAAANKKSDRIATENVAYAQVSAPGSVTVVVEISAETDFVAKNAELQTFVRTVADAVEEQNPVDVDAPLNLTTPGLDKKVDDLLKEKIQAIGENVKIRRFARMEGPVVSYVHVSDRIGVIARFGTSAGTATKSEFQECAKNIAMQIVAIDLSYLNEQTVLADVVEHEKRILTEQVINDGKPAVTAEKIVVGRLSKFFKNTCLADQVYVKDSDKNVQQYTDSIAKELSDRITIEVSARFEKGEGLEKKKDDFADEVTSMVK